MTQAEVHTAGGPSPATLYLIEAGRRDSYQPRILRGLEHALGWQAGSIHRTLAGDAPLLDAESQAPLFVPGRPASRLNGQTWAAGFRQLAMTPRGKLTLLCSLLEEVVAELASEET
jgi:hypothetical protein